MSSHDDYAPRSSRRDRPRYDEAGGLPYPDQEDITHAPRRSRNDVSPLPAYAHDPRDDPHRRQRDPDHRNQEVPAMSDKKAPKDYRDYPSDHGVDAPRKSNTTARRRSPYSEEDIDRPRNSRREAGRDEAYGRSKGYREPVPEPELYRNERIPAREHTSRRPKDYDDLSPGPPRRSNTTREPDRRRREDPYDAPRSRRARTPDDRYGDRDRGYKSDGRDGYGKSREDPRYDDRRRPARHDDGYLSDRAHRSNKDRDRDRDRDRYADKDRDRRRTDSDRGHRDYGRDRDRDRDRRDRDRDRDRSRDRSRDRDRGSDKHKKKGFNLNMDDVGKLYEQGQKHYKSVAPLLEKVAKMYMDSKGGGK